MFQLIRPDGVTFMTDKFMWICAAGSDPNHYTECSRSDAEGILYKDSPFLFADGFIVEEIDSGDVYASFENNYMSIDDMAAAIREGVNEV